MRADIVYKSNPCLKNCRARYVRDAGTMENDVYEEEITAC